MKILLFSERDKEIIENLEYRPGLKPEFDPVKNCLVWEDEYSPELSSSGHETLYDLWIARSHIHRNIPFGERVLGGEYYEKLWREAMQMSFSWPGFKRLELNNEDKIFLERKVKEYTSQNGTI